MSGFDHDAWLAATGLFVTAGRFGYQSERYAALLELVVSHYDVAQVLCAFGELTLAMVDDHPNLAGLFTAIEGDTRELYARYEAGEFHDEVTAKR